MESSAQPRGMQPRTIFHVCVIIQPVIILPKCPMINFRLHTLCNSVRDSVTDCADIQVHSILRHSPKAGVSKLWPTGPISPLSLFYWNTATSMHSYLVSSCLHATVAELSRCNRERSKIFTFQLFAEKSLPIPALKETTQSDKTF